MLRQLRANDSQMIITVRNNTGTYRTDRDFLEIITEIQTEYLSGTDPDTVFGKMLKLIQDVTESEFGVIAGFASPISTDNPKAVIHSANLATHDCSKVKSGRAADFDLSTFGVLEDSIRQASTTNELVIENTVRSKAHSEPMPISARSYKSMMCIPLSDGPNLIGFIALANRRGGYRVSLRDYIQPIIATTAALVRSERLYQERLDARALLIQEKERAENANRAKSNFLSSMSHDLRTPLNAILGFSEILQGEYFGSLGSQKNKEYVELIQSSGKSLLSYVDRLLAFDAIEQENYTLNVAQTDIIELFGEFCSTVKEKAAALDINIECQTPATAVMAECDPRAIMRVLNNLSANALKFTPPNGTITLTLDEAPEADIRFTVADTGPGFSEAALEGFGMPFSAEDAFVADEQKGFGIGLAECKRLIELHGGNLEALEEAQSGATVSATIPTKHDALEQV